MLVIVELFQVVIDLAESNLGLRGVRSKFLFFESFNFTDSKTGFMHIKTSLTNQKGQRRRILCNRDVPVSPAAPCGSA